MLGKFSRRGCAVFRGWNGDGALRLYGNKARPGEPSSPSLVTQQPEPQVSATGSEARARSDRAQTVAADPEFRGKPEQRLVPDHPVQLFARKGAAHARVQRSLAVLRQRAPSVLSARPRKLDLEQKQLRSLRK